jgi:ferredoxin
MLEAASQKNTQQGVQATKGSQLSPSLQQDLRSRCHYLLSEGMVDVVIGYGRSTDLEHPFPVFVRKPNQVDRLIYNPHCHANLAVYLTRKEIKALGKPAICVTARDERALVVLQRESQIERDSIYVIGIVTPEHGVPRFADEVIGDTSTVAAAGQEGESDAHYEAFMQKSPAERMAYWQAEFARCIRCYACRQACPMCYCEQCIVEKNQPVVVEASPTLRGNFAWQITRAFHQAGRCVGCGACTSACPVGIDLTLLNRSLAKAAEQHFDYRSGDDPDREPVIGGFSADDREEFIK